jgi:acetolactate synthase-1/2/3 large subunit
MQISDYIIHFLEQKGVKHAFLLVGGGAMHMNNSLGKSGKISYTACLHEQAAGIAAEAYARVTNTPGVLMVTSGPGATNAITPVTAAWIESTPMFVLSGQVKRADMINGQGVRQMGIQEVDIIPMVKPVTKYAVVVDNPEKIKYHLERAWHEAVTGRPGPVWLDIPLDVQAWQIEESTLEGYDAAYMPPKVSRDEIAAVIEMLRKSERPCVLLGNGIRLSGALSQVDTLINRLGIPVLTTWNGIDLVDNEHPLFFGRPGSVGQRAATIIQQNCDFLLTIGSRLNLLQTGFNFDAFARAAKHVMVDIDRAELHKINVRPALPVHSDAGIFISSFIEALGDTALPKYETWHSYCVDIKKRYPLMMKEYHETVNGTVNTFLFVNRLSKVKKNDDVFVATSSGSALDVAMPVFEVKKGQRVFSTKGLASMGFDLPACIGACLASGKKRTVCVTGDGGFQMNIQEFETLRRLWLPIKIFVVDNNGYAMIRNSHMGAFGGRLTACTPESGLTLPDVLKQAAVYGIVSAVIETDADMDNLEALIQEPQPLICKVKADIAPPLIPRQSSYRNKEGQMESLPIEEMRPFLSEEEMENIMLIGRYKEK